MEKRISLWPTVGRDYIQKLYTTFAYFNCARSQAEENMVCSLAGESWNFQVETKVTLRLWRIPVLGDSKSHILQTNVCLSAGFLKEFQVGCGTNCTATEKRYVQSFVSIGDVVRQ